MNQELTISSGLPVYLYQEHLGNLFNRNRELIDSIAMNYLCFDDQKEYFNHLMESFDQIDPSAPVKRQLESFLLELFTKKGRPKTIKGGYSEINICKASKDKIYIAPEKQDSEISNLQASNQKLKICGRNNLFEIVRPLPSVFLLKPDTVYNLDELIKPFAKGSKSITVIDPYLFNPGAMRNLDQILSRTVYETVFIKCNDPENYPTEEAQRKNREKYSKLLNYIEEVKKEGSVVEISFLAPGHEERYIIYDEVQVYIPGGLDCLDSHGMIKRQKRGLYLRFEKRDFEAFPINQELNPVNP
ncbi:MAG: hypothetical protein LCH52_00985 [Bacteroidetes bacterium]|nr:hypothetical protein [Bacteroidota bacterium]